MCCLRIQKFLFIIYIIFKMTANVNCKERNYHVEFITDVIDRLGHSNKIVTNLCWNKDDLVALSKTISYKFVSHNMSNYFSDNSGPNIFVLNISCEGSFNFITKSFRDDAFDSTSTWVIFGKLNQIKSYNFYFPINSLVYVVDKDFLLRFFVKIICKYNKAYTDYIEVDIAEWNPREKFIYFKNVSLPANRTDLMGSPIRISYVVSGNNTLNHLMDYRDIHTDKVTKANYVIISYLVDLINASKVDIWADTWGYRNDITNTYNGMYGHLMSDVADIGGTPGFIQASRLSHFKFIPPTSPAKVLFIFQAPPLSYTSNIFALPFSLGAWVTFLFLIIISTMLIYYIIRIERSLGVNTEDSNIMDVVLLECSALTQRGNSFEPKTLSGRIALYYTFTLSIYMYTGFSGYIIVLLQSTSEGITDLATLYDSKFEIGVEDTPYNRYYFTTPNEQSNETYRQLLYEQRIAPRENWFTPRDGVEMVRHGCFAFHVEVGAAYFMIMDTFKENEMCKVRSINTIFTAGDPFIAVPRNSVYTDLFLVGFRRIFETGLQKREHQKYFAIKPQCSGRHGNYDSVRLLDCYFPFLILGFGVVMSLLIFLSEIAYNNVRKI